MTPVSAPVSKLQMSTPGLPAPSPALRATTTLRASPVLTLLTAGGWHRREQPQKDQAEG